MAIVNGVIKVDSSTTPYKGVEIADIQLVLGSPKNDIGQLILANDGSGNPLVNKWAKYKPVKKSGLDFPNQRNANFSWKTTQQIVAIPEVPWWKAYNGQCGMTFTTYSSLGTQTIATTGFFHDLLETNPWPLHWGYERPTGGINQYPFRFFDFNYYDHNAPKPVTGVYDNLRLYGSNDKLIVELDESRAGDNLGIQLSDISINNVSAWYVGILIYKSGSFAYSFSTTTVGNGADSVEFTGMSNFEGSVTIVPFLSSVRWGSSDPEQSGVFLSCDVEPQTVTIRPNVSLVTMTIDAQWKFSLPGIARYDVRIINNKGTSVTVSNMEIGLYDGDPLNGGVRLSYTTIATFTMSNGDVHDEIGTLDLNENAYDSTKTYYIVVSSDRSEVNGKEEVQAARNPSNQ